MVYICNYETKNQRNQRIKGIKYYEIAKKMNITQSSYARFERGDTKSDIDRIQLFANVVGMSFVDVLMYPEYYVNIKDIAKELKLYEPEVIIQLKVSNSKKEDVLKAILGDKSLELINI